MPRFVSFMCMSGKKMDMLQWNFIMMHSILRCMQTIQWRHNGRDGVSNHQLHDCLLNCLFRLRSKKTSTLHITGLCVGNSPVTGEFSTQMASKAENVSISWCHHGWLVLCVLFWLDWSPFIHILQWYFTGTWAIIWLPKCQWSNPEEYG